MPSQVIKWAGFELYSVEGICCECAVQPASCQCDKCKDVYCSPCFTKVCNYKLLINNPNIIPIFKHSIFFIILYLHASFYIFNN